MWEVGPAHPVHQPWIEQVRPRIADAGLDRGRPAELIPPSGYVPDFLNPAPAGPAPTLAQEHPSLSWDDDALRLERRQRTLSRKAAGSGLVLIPSVFTGPTPFTRVAPPEPPQLAYPARGIGALWQPRSATRTQALAAVLGRSRTRLLTELDTPASTTAPARRTGLSPSAVSQYLPALRDAGLVSAHRAGRSVLYARTSVAESLLAG
ncbi:ArsR/SmtB family transcription factor [Streptomyces sp. NPDC059874]|uniref:ArsR/SmtB family transcription factor n=1 Tax=Streptomyces sp. NPDC059874 TaxID=3346983 RepID=UPI0036675A4D